MRFLAFLCALLCLPGAAQAKWIEASSQHFVVYADANEGAVRKFATQLESFHAAMALLTGTAAAVPSPSNRVTVFVVSNLRQVRKLYGEGGQFIGGFYLPRAGGSVAIVAQITPGGERLDFSMIALLHEYAHHFAISGSTFPLPRWLSEGSAEFYASAAFERDGSVKIGMPAQHRAAELFLSRDVKVEELLDYDLYRKNRSRSYDAFYGKSWLLYHYLQFDEARKNQLATYFRLMVAGKSPRDAALEAFGDFKVLEQELDKYLVRRNLTIMQLPPQWLETGPVTLRPLREGEAAIMPVIVQSRRGVNEEEAQAVVAEARKVAALYPTDPAVQAALAEAEFDAGRDAAAIAAADAALALDPAQVNAYVQKGYAMFRMAGSAPDPAAAFKAARQPFLALNQIENDHPLPLIYYYRSFVEQGETPPELAVDALARAVELAPFDKGLRINLAMQQLRDRKWEAAKRNLVPIAYDPHGGAFAGRVRDVLEAMDKPGWDGAGLEELQRLLQGDEQGEQEDGAG